MVPTSIETAETIAILSGRRLQLHPDASSSRVLPRAMEPGVPSDREESRRKIRRAESPTAPLERRAWILMNETAGQQDNRTRARSV